MTADKKREAENFMVVKMSIVASRCTSQRAFCYANPIFGALAYMDLLCDQITCVKAQTLRQKFVYGLQDVLSTVAKVNDGAILCRGYTIGRYVRTKTIEL